MVVNEVVVILKVPQVATMIVPVMTDTPLMNASPNTVMGGRGTFGDFGESGAVEDVSAEMDP